MPNLFSQYEFQPSDLTFGQAAAIVARTISADGPPSVIAQAKDALKDALRRWARDHPWNYLRIERAYALNAGDDRIDVGNTFYHIYDVRWTAGGTYHTLRQMEQRDYDRIIEDQTQTDLPVIYTLFHLGETQELRVSPVPQSSGSVTVKGYRPMNLAPADDDHLDVLNHHTDGVLHLARAHLLAQFSGEGDRRNYFLQMGIEALGSARMDDLHSPDQELVFMPDKAIAANRQPLTDWDQLVIHYGY